MFMGHYAAALAAKAAEPRAPLWTYVAGAQLLDIGWSSLVMAGAERVRIDNTLPGAPLDLYHMPWSHSLPAAVAWSVVAALLAGWALKLPRRAVLALGLVVFSHWGLDLLVHRPDLALWFGGPKVGLALWNQPVLEEAVEVGLLGLAGAAWAAQRARAHQSGWPALAFLVGLLVLQILPMVAPMTGGPAPALAATTLATYVLITAAAALLERGQRTVKVRPPA
ncbi:MAG TPA: hypothetical protein VF459_03815 [Caulobacteraceae bacterium]